VKILGASQAAYVNESAGDLLADVIRDRPALTAAAIAEALQDLRKMKGIDNARRMRLFSRFMARATEDLRINAAEGDSRQRLTNFAKGIARVIADEQIRGNPAPQGLSTAERKAAWKSQSSETLVTGVEYDRPGDGAAERDVYRIAAEMLRELRFAKSLSTTEKQDLFTSSVETAVAALPREAEASNATQWMQEHPEAKRNVVQDLMMFVRGLSVVLNNGSFNKQGRENIANAWEVGVDRRDNPGTPLT
jgi:hypothetical protein